MALTSWRRHGRVVFAGVALAFATAVFVAIRDRPTPPLPPAVERTDPAAVVESTGALVIQTREGTQQFRVEARRQLSYADGTIRLEGVKLTIPRADGNQFVVTGDRAEVRDNQTKVTVRGGVRLTGSEGATAVAEQASYDDTDRTVRLAGPVQFTHGSVAASGVGAVYDGVRNVISLLDQAVVRVTAQEGGTPLEVTAGAAAWARGEHTWRFERGVAMTRTTQTMAGDAAAAHLTDDDQRLQLVELRGHSRTTGGPAAPGSADSMRADDMDLIYAEAGGLLERVRLAGSASVEMSGGGPDTWRRITGDRIEATLVNGQTVTELAASGRVQVDFPAVGSGPARLIRAMSLRATGEAGRGLTSVHFDREVEFQESRTATEKSAAVERHVRSQTLQAAVQAGLRDIDEAVFSGDVIFREAALRATAGEARYRPGHGLVQLLPGERPARSPQVTDERLAIDAGRIEVTLEPRRLLAEDDVRSMFRPVPESERTTGGSPRPTAAEMRVPRLLDADQPVYVTATRLTYDRLTSLASYSGSVRLWQGETTILGDAIVLDEGTGSLTVSGSARSVVALEQVNEETGAREPVNTHAEADGLRYDDDLRRATYTANAQLVGPQGHLKADRIEVYLREAGDALERLEGYGAVRLRTGRRTAFGSRLTYVDGDGRYVVNGTPVRIVEDLGAECRETTGRTLTFFRSADTIAVDGNAEQRTRTKTGGKCPELPSF